MTFDYKIGPTQLKMRPLLDWGIPYPTTPPHVEYPVRTTGGDGMVRGDGWPRTTWEWSTLSQPQLNRLRGFVTSGYLSATVYIRTRLNDGTFASFSAVLTLPDLTGTDGTPVAQDVGAYENVAMHFSRMVAV